MTMIQTKTVWVGDRRLGWAQDVVLVLGAAYVLALSAQLRIWLPFSPVPVTAQTLVVLLMGALMGRRRALASVGAYLAAGVVGLPFFAANGLWGPTGGYLVGFAAAVYLLASLLARGWDRRPVTVLAALLLANGAIYVVGLPWLARYVGLRAALPLGLFPFVVGDLAKLVCATGIVLVSRSMSAGGH